MKVIIKKFINQICNLQSAICNNKKGFTLIELAIVMVIIGLILGAVMKGQDLIINARTKKFVTKVKSWETATWSYLDRKGRFPGDTDRDGKIGGTDFRVDLTGASFINPPYQTTADEGNIILMGSSSFYVFAGTDGGVDDSGKNVMFICVSADCTETFDAESLIYAEALDVSIDGIADGTTGQVVGVDGAITSDTSWSGFVTASDTSVSTDFVEDSTLALVYYFDGARQ